MKLPAFVRMIVTSRPEAEDMFKAWKPMYIKPEKEDNMGDLEKLLYARIKSCKNISERLRPKAVKVVLNKSLVSIPG